VADLALQAQIKARDRLSVALRRVAKITRGRLVPAFSRARVVVGRLRAATGRLSKSIKKIGRSLRAVAVGSGVLGAATVGVWKFASAQAEALDHAAKFARRAGVTAQSYLELQHAAALAGVEVAEFDAAMQKGTRVIGELKAGQGALGTLLKKVNPAFLEQIRATKTSTEAFDLLFKGMSKLKDPTKRAAFAAAAFGRAGQRMTLIVEGGAEALKKSRAEFTKIHGVVDGKALKSAEDFVDTNHRMKTAIGGVRVAIATRLFPVLQPLIKRLTEWVSKNREIIGTKVARVVKAIARALRSVKWGDVIKPFREWGKLLLGIAKILGPKGIAIVGSVAILAKIGGAFKGLVSIASTALTGIAAGGAMTGLMAALAGLAVAVGIVASQWRNLTGEANTYAKVSRDQIDAVRESAVRQKAVTEAARAGGAGSKLAQATLIQAFPRLYSAADFAEVNAKAERRGSRLVQRTSRSSSRRLRRSRGDGPFVAKKAS
jgi:hypothetical protein